MSVRLTYCYRSDDPTIIEAKTKDHEESMVMEMQAKEFAALFGAVPTFSMGLVPHFVGIGFRDAPKNKALWTSPKSNDPRSMLKPQKAVPKKLLKEWQDLVVQWTANFPHDAAKPRESHLLKAFGQNEQMIQGHGMGYFYHKDVSWVVSTLSLGGPFEEVKASEYAAADAEYRLHAARAQALAQEQKPAQIVPAANEENSDV